VPQKASFLVKAEIRSSYSPKSVSNYSRGCPSGLKQSSTSHAPARHSLLRPTRSNELQHPNAIAHSRPARLSAWWLWPDGQSGKAVGQCCGWVPNQRPKNGIYGYATDDIFYLEICLFNEICENGADLFNLDVGQPFRCRFSDARFNQLKHILLTPWEEPRDATKCSASHTCNEHRIPGLRKTKAG